MSRIEARLAELGLVLPEPPRFPPGAHLPLRWVNVRGDRAYVSGHGPQEPDGSTSAAFGAVGDALTPEEAALCARKTALSMLGSIKRELGDLDRITGWCRAHGMVNCVPGFTQTPLVMNGFSDLILAVFGAEIGGHARTAVGVCGLPMNLPVEIEAEVMIAP